MNRRDFVRGSILACAGASIDLPALADGGKRIALRLQNADGASTLQSFVTGDEANAVDCLILPPALRLVEHPSLPVVFALLSSDSWEHRPRGAVSSVRYCATTGKFLEHRLTPLSLGAIGIVEADVRNNGKELSISTSAGIRNVFQLTDSGEVSELVSVRKTLSPLST